MTTATTLRRSAVETISRAWGKENAAGTLNSLMTRRLDALLYYHVRELSSMCSRKHPIPEKKQQANLHSIHSLGTASLNHAANRGALASTLERAHNHQFLHRYLSFQTKRCCFEKVNVLSLLRAGRRPASGMAQRKSGEEGIERKKKGEQANPRPREPWKICPYVHTKV